VYSDGIDSHAKLSWTAIRVFGVETDIHRVNFSRSLIVCKERHQCLSRVQRRTMVSCERQELWERPVSSEAQVQREISFQWETRVQRKTSPKWNMSSERD
jgi:hypothetical protein